jgi:WhiB family redox-sensing transcriptional regulator
VITRSLALQWEERAACRGEQSAFFLPPAWPESLDVQKKREVTAKQVCARCPVCSECLAYALRHPEAIGVWGGRTERERRELSVGS